MNCRKVARRIPGYLDGAANHRDHAGIREHIKQCARCRGDIEQYRRLALALARVQPKRPAAELASRIRVEVSRASARQPWHKRLSSRMALLFQNIFEPLAVPATGGILTAALAFAIIAQNLLVGVPLGAVPNDLPTNLLQPARLEFLAPFPVSTQGAMSAGKGAPVGGAGALEVEAILDAQGEAVSYQIISGPRNEAVRRQLDQVLLFSRFRPQLSFGRPMPGGRVILSFDEIHVKG